MTKKSTKASQIREMLTQGFSALGIKKRLKVSESYIYALKKELEAEWAKQREINAKFIADEKAKIKAKAEAEEKTKADEKTKAEEKAKAEAEAKANEVDKVLDARADQYGSFMQSAEVAIKIKSVMHNSIARKDMHLFPDQILALDMIAVKLSRIVGGNPAHRDSWLDIAGYAKLVADRLDGVSR